MADDEEPVGPLDGTTLEDQWRANPNPPEDYGEPDPQTISEEVGGVFWMWHAKNPYAILEFFGDAMEIRE